MGWGEYLAGFAVFALMAGGVLAGALIIARRRLPHLRGVVRVLAVALLTTLGLLAVHLVPGLLGILARGSVLGCTALWLGAALLVRPVARDPEPVPEAPPGGRVADLLAAGSVLLLAAFTLAFGRDQLVLAPGSIDILNFHLPGIAGWIREGSIWNVHEFVADISPGRYPNNGDVVLLAGILPWHSDFLSHLLPYGFYALCGLGTYALSTELGAPRAAAATAGCLLVAMPVVAVPTLVNSFPDVIMLFGFAVGITFLLRHRRTLATSDLVLAGLALGLSFGTKWYAVPAVAVLVGVWAVGSALERRPLSGIVRQGAALVGLISLAGGIWMLRNWIESGNPVYPAEVSVFGLTVFSAPVDVVREAAGFTIADYVDEPQVWVDYILPQYRDVFALAGPLLLIGLVLLTATLLWRGASRRLNRRLLGAGLIATALIAALYSLIPYTAGGAPGEPTLVGADARYLVPALLLGLALVGAGTRAAPWAPAAFAAVALVAIVDGIRLSASGRLSGGTLELADWAQALVILAVAAASAWAISRTEVRWARHRVALGAAAAACLAALCVAGYRVQDSFLADRYRGIDATADWIREHAPEDTRVGLAGLWTDSFSPALPAFGPRFDNHVEYVGEFVEGTLRAYERREEFAAALDERGIEVLVVGRGRPPRARVREERWAMATGFAPVARSDTLSLYRRASASTSLPRKSRSGRVAESRVASRISGPSRELVYR
jgi:Dolichyl-phosphate-mannose-protein mannosyltransferase